ncbi:MAG: hypothetical protein GOV15_01040, partial [Candidatus Diapherotrites archaeon]|nr:hypothetical protein [Candidatus Diapherotrites archaeon]
MLKYYLPALLIVLLLSGYLLLNNQSVIFTGQATQIIDDPSSTQKSVILDFNDGTGVGTIVNGNTLTATTNNAVWTSNSINTRPEKTGDAYSFWEEIIFTSSNPTSITYETRVSQDTSTWSDWSVTNDLQGRRTIHSSQDKYLQLRITFLTTGDEVSGITVLYTPAFTFKLDPIYDGFMEFEETDYRIADRRVVTQGNHFYYDNEDGTFDRAKFYGFQLYGPSNFPTHSQADQLCTRLRKLGVNTIKTQIVRQSEWTPQHHTIVQQWQDGVTWN